LKYSKKIIFIVSGIIVFGIVCAFIFPDFKIKTLTSYFKNETVQNDFIEKDSTSSLIIDLMKMHPGWFSNILDSLSTYEVQIIYTQINRDEDNKPHFKEYSFRLNDKAYFNPASLVKLPVSLMSLEKLNLLKVPGLNKDCRIKFDSAYNCQLKYETDTNVIDKIPTISHYIEEIMLVSDNDAYCRLYEFLGQQYLNEHLWDMGYKKTLILQRFNYCCYDCNKYTNPVCLYNDKDEIIYQQPLVINPENYKNPLGEIKKGHAYYDGHNRYIEKPKDFSYSNNLPLQDVHDILLSLIFPEDVPENKSFKLTKKDRDFIIRFMAMYPRESDFLAYHNVNLYPDNFKKYFLWGNTGKSITDTSKRSINIVGQSFGYLADCAYIVDFKNQLEFILTAVIFTNKDGIFHPTHYQYTSIGLPFLENLGNTFYNYELTRVKKFKPNLTELEQNLKAINNKHK